MVAQLSECTKKENVEFHSLKGWTVWYVNKVVKKKKKKEWIRPLLEQIPLDTEGSGPAEQGLLVVTVI